MGARVIVGVDGSKPALVAVRWAAAEARLRGAELVALRVHDPDGAPADPHAAAGASDGLLAAVAGDSVTVRDVTGSPAVELTAACAPADVLVVGSRGRSALPGIALGSVARGCVARASCPVVVIRVAEEHGHRRVVVGLDTSGASRRALRVAAEEAALRSAPLHAVHVVHWDELGVEMVEPTTAALLDWGRQLVDQELGRARVRATAVVAHGHPPEEMVEQSAHAALLVLGTRGRNPLSGLLGSVSDRCVQETQCPLMLVPAGRDRIGDDAGANGRAQ